MDAYINTDEFVVPPMNKKLKMIIHPFRTAEYSTTIGYYDEKGWHCPYDETTGYEVVGWKEIE